MLADLAWRQSSSRWLLTKHGCSHGNGWLLISTGCSRTDIGSNDRVVLLHHSDKSVSNGHCSNDRWLLCHQAHKLIILMLTRWSAMNGSVDRCCVVVSMDECWSAIETTAAVFGECCLH